MTEKQIITRNAANGTANGVRMVSVSVPALPAWPDLDAGHRDETAPRGRVIRRQPLPQRRTAAEIAIEAIREIHQEAMQ